MRVGVGERDDLGVGDGVGEQAELLGGHRRRLVPARLQARPDGRHAGPQPGGQELLQLAVGAGGRLVAGWPVGTSMDVNYCYGVTPSQTRPRWLEAHDLIKAAWTRPPPKYERGYGAIFSRHVKQANEGCDFDFLEGTAPTAEPEIH